MSAGELREFLNAHAVIIPAGAKKKELIALCESVEADS